MTPDISTQSFIKARDIISGVKGGKGAELTIIMRKVNLLEQFNSKSNAVYLAETEGIKCVYKKYSDKLHKTKEAEILNKLKHTGYAPHNIEEGDDYLINQYLEGDLLLDLYARATSEDDTEELERLADMLSIFIQIFHSVTGGYVLHDVNFRNFIISGGRCYGIDYEKAQEGMPYSDVAGVIAYASSYNIGELAGAFPFIKRILDNFHMDIIDVINDVRSYLDIFNGIRSNMLDVDFILDQLMKL